MPATVAASYPLVENSSNAASMSAALELARERSLARGGRPSRSRSALIVGAYQPPARGDRVRTIPAIAAGTGASREIPEVQTGRRAMFIYNDSEVVAAICST